MKSRYRTSRIMLDCAYMQHLYPYRNNILCSCKEKTCMEWTEQDINTRKYYYVFIHLGGHKCEVPFSERG
jgi:hypothetical protein